MTQPLPHSSCLLLSILLCACNPTTAPQPKPQPEPKAAPDHSPPPETDANAHTPPRHMPNLQPQPGRNADPSFVGIQGMKAALRSMPGSGHGNLTKFKAWAAAGQWHQFGPSHHHYDWWMFPTDRKTAGQGMKYTVHKQDIEELKKDATWLQDYRAGAILLMQSWGWDVHNQRPYAHPAAAQRWRHHDVRLGKLANSLILFGQQDLYHSLRAYADHLQAQDVTLQAWVLQYFP